ncbi:MAG TPA: hypothetical protein VFQ74_03020 [Pseudolysinimonas sp.]|nr:hypothetical protein [Pseudolysinimonas sp.]
MSDPILELLDEEGMSGDAELRSILNAMRSEATSIRPIPSPAVANLMSPRPARTPRRALTGHRRIVTGLIVLGSLAVGAGAAAANPDVRSATQHFAQTVIGVLGSAGVPSSPMPASHRPAPLPRPTSTGAPSHPTPTDHPGSNNGQVGSSHAPGSGAPSSPPGKGSPSAHPEPSPAASGHPHHP